MIILELFSGTASFSNVAKKRGHRVFTLDIDKQFKPNLCIDILDFNINMLPEEFKKPNVIWASPPCTTFSVASIRHYWENGKPKNEKTLKGIAIVKKTLEIIKQLKPDYFIIENPRGMLRKQKFIRSIHKDTITYCQYGLKTQKPTDLFNNLNHTFKPMCKPGALCHERASRGARAGIQGINNSFSNLGSGGKIQRAIVPKALCEEIIRHIEKNPLPKS